MFSYHGTNGPASSPTLCLEEVRQVTVPVGRQTTTDFNQSINQSINHLFAQNTSSSETARASRRDEQDSQLQQVHLWLPL